MALIYSVEDEKNIQNVILIALQNSGYEVNLFSNEEGFFESMEQRIPDLILLDVMLPGKNGIEILKQIKSMSKWKEIPVMMISAKSTEIDKVIGLDYGADDYLGKPFGVLELVSRVKALLRRFAKSNTEMIEIASLRLDNSERSVFYEDQSITLTAKEFALLKLLMDKNQKVVRREEILNQVWGYDFVGETRTLDVHIKELRNKLAKAGVPDNVIQTVRGVGYKINL